jgi:hypothetical protein
MPVPKSKQKRYGAEVAAITAILERKGVSPSAANAHAKRDADRDILGEGKKKKKRKAPRHKK